MSLKQLQGLLHDTILDQAPPLVDLKQFLCQISMGGNQSNVNKSKTNLVLEELPEIKDNIIKEAEQDGGFMAIAELQESIFLCRDKEKITGMAKRLNEAYNTDLLADMEEKISSDEKSEKDKENNKKAEGAVDKKCANCFGEAEKKCSNCKVTYYCSR